MRENRPPDRNARISYLLLSAALSVTLCASSTAATQDKGLGDKAYKAEVLEKIAGLIETKYVIPEAAARHAEEFREKCSGGAYDDFSDPKEFAEKVTADLRSITSDQHITFRVIEPSDIGESPVGSLHHPIRYHRLGIKENKGFSKLEWMDGNIGYFDVRRFYYYPDVRDMVAGAMRFLSNADAIIIDLRENGGGSGDYLSSCFLQHPTQLTGSYSRTDDLLTECWTSEVPGAGPLTDVPLFLLTSGRTFSAAESFAYDMKTRKRAVIVGEPTRGGAHSVDLYQVDARFEIYISTARAVSPVTGGNWEGTGVIPDLAVPAVSALDTALVLARQAGAEYAKGKEERLKQAAGRMQALMDRAETLFRGGETEQARAALDSMFLIAGDHGLVNEFFIDVLAYNYFSAEDEQILYAVLQKKIDLFPGSPTAYEAMGYAYFRNGRFGPAIASYEKALELDPSDHNAKSMIERLRGE